MLYGVADDFRRQRIAFGVAGFENSFLELGFNSADRVDNGQLHLATNRFSAVCAHTGFMRRAGGIHVRPFNFCIQMMRCVPRQAVGRRG